MEKEKIIIAILAAALIISIIVIIYLWGPCCASYPSHCPL
jgi:hypothetical protein